SSRFLLRPRDLERSLRFYEETLGLAVYREWGSGQDRGVVFFLGGGLLEVAGSTAGIPSEAVRLLLQVRELRAVRSQLAEKIVVVEEEPELKPGGRWEMVVRDPDGLALAFAEVPSKHPLRREAKPDPPRAALAL